MRTTLRSGAFVLSAALATTLVAASPAMAADDDPAPDPGTSSSGALWSRIAGEDRYETSILTARDLIRSGAVAARGSTVYIAGGYAYPDSLAVTPLADCTDGPVLLMGKTGVEPKVVDYIKELRPSKIVILGGPLALDANLEGLLKARGVAPSLGPINGWDRVAGETRAETAYMLAADTLEECHDIGGGVIADAKNDLRTLEAREAAYQDALAAYQATAADYIAKRDVYEAAEARLAALQAELAGLAAQLETVGDAPTAEEIRAAVNASAAAQDRLQAALDAEEVFVDLLGALEGQGDTTLNTDSTLSEYIAEFPARAAAIRGAIDETPGVGQGTSLNDAIARAKDNVDDRRAELDGLDDAVARMILEVQEAAAANAHNQPILDAMGRLQVQINAATTARNGARTAYNTAAAALVQAQVRLAAATLLRPLPSTITRAEAAVAAARDAVVANPRSGAHPAFFATGHTFQFAQAAGPAAAEKDGVVLLTSDGRQNAWTEKYIRLAKSQNVAVGHYASQALGTNVTWKTETNDPYQAAADVNKHFFAPSQNDSFKQNNAPVAVVSGEYYGDSVLGASWAANHNGTVLFTKKADLTTPTYNYIAYTLDELSDPSVVLFGGPMRIDHAAISAQLADAISQ